MKAQSVETKLGLIEIGDIIEFNTYSAGGYWAGIHKGQVIGFTPTGKIRVRGRSFPASNLHKILRKSHR